MKYNETFFSVNFSYFGPNLFYPEVIFNEVFRIILFVINTNPLHKHTNKQL